MKKIFILAALALFAMSASAQHQRIDLRHESKAEITKSEFTNLRAVFSYGSIESIDVSTERGTFSEIAIEGTYVSGEIGTPQLPASHQLLAVPFGATPQVSIINYSTTDYHLSDYGIHTIMPHQPSLRKDQRPEDIPFVYKAEAYQTRGFATAPAATIEVQGTMRGIRIGSLVVNPVSYDPVSNTLRVFNDIEVEVRFEGADRAETERMLLNTYSPYFDIVYKQMFNYRQILDVYDDHPDLMAYPVHMIVITPESFMTALQPWLNWKIQKGFDVNVYTTAQTGTTYSAIRSYVQNLYNTGVNQGNTPTFLILVGDVAQVPNTTGSNTQKVTDLYYGSIDNDYFPDMFYSRMSAENTNQLTAIINKVLQYEQYTMPDPSYLNNVTLIAGWDSYWTSRVGAPTINYATTYYYNTAHGFNEVHSHVNQSQYTGCYNALSTGVGFVNYTAHGDNNMWYQPQFTNSNVNQLTNTNKYFLAMGNCCLSGNFGYSSMCFGEAMIRAENKAAYSYIGSCPNTYWYEDYYFGVGATNVFSQTPSLTNTATGVYDGIWMDETYNTVSSMTFLGNIAVCYASTGGYQTSSNPTYYWQAYHVLGDGSIMPYRVQPTANTVNHASTFPANSTSFTVNAEAGSYVGISQNNVLKGAAFVPASGTVSVPVSSVNAGQVRIVVTKPQRQPYIQDINVSGGGTPTYTITASANPANGGTVAFGSKDDRDLTYSFEGSLEGWTTIDADGDGFNWQLASVLMAGYSIPSHNGEDCVASQSYDANTGALTPDNYLVSPQVALGGSITFWACAQDAAWPSEHFGVAVSTTSNNNPSDFTILQEWTMTAKGSGAPTQFTRDGQTRDQGNWYQYTVDLSAYDGQSGYLAIRHFNCSDFFYLDIDDITITEGSGSSGGDPISATFTQGQSCTLTATPNTGYQFVNWTENGNVVSSSANYTFTVTGDRNLVANFQVQTQQYTITTTASPSNGGTVSGAGTYNQGATCTVSATANAGYTFVNWTENGSQVSTNANYSFTVTGNRNLVANFQVQTPQYTVTVTANPSNGGTVSGTGTYYQGATCTVTATANTGYAFVNWTVNGNQVSTNASYSFTVTGNTALTANFERITYTIEATSGENGTITPSGTITVLYGESQTFEMTPDTDYQIQDVSVDGTSVGAVTSYTFDNVTANHSIRVTFYSTVDVDEILSQRLVVYPNPTSGMITLTNNGIKEVKVYNTLGMMLMEIPTDGRDRIEIDLSSLPEGIYLLQASNDGQSITKQVVKMR